jgi:hypothetical protein
MRQLLAADEEFPPPFRFVHLGKLGFLRDPTVTSSESGADGHAAELLFAVFVV